MKTAYTVGQIVYPARQVCAEMNGKLPDTAYKVVDPRSGWRLDDEGNHYRNNNYNTCLVRLLTKGEDGEWVEGDLDVKTPGEDFRSEKRFREGCENWANPKKGTWEYGCVLRKKVNALSEELEIAVDDEGLLKLLTFYKENV